MVAENKRIQLLKGFLEMDENDSFSRYALALEYVNSDQIQSAKQEFEQLLNQDANYTATYYHLGKLYEKIGLEEDAKRTYKQGISITQKLGQSHALKELREAYMMLTGGDDEDE